MKDGKRDWAVAVPVRFLFATTARITQRSVEDDIMYFELRSRAQDTRETRPGRYSEQIPVFVLTFRRLHEYSNSSIRPFDAFRLFTSLNSCQPTTSRAVRPIEREHIGSKY